MFQAMKRIVGCLGHNKVGEGAIERAIRQSFLGIYAVLAIEFIILDDTSSVSFQCFLMQSVTFTKNLNFFFWNLFIVSADMAHGIHPNFMEKHEEHHRPEMQKGLVIKHNANQRYATSGITAFLFKEVGKIHNLPTQVFYH